MLRSQDIVSPLLASWKVKAMVFLCAGLVLWVVV